VADKPPKLPKRSPAERIVDRLTRARLCFGDPIGSGARTVIPVARVRVYGGFGFGRGGERTTDSGGGGGGYVDAHPIGFIEVTPQGSQFTAIPDPERGERMLLAAARAAAMVAAGLAGAKRLRGPGRRPSARLLGR
jgi:uncharacterized spore protein YtfJ